MIRQSSECGVTRKVELGYRLHVACFHHGFAFAWPSRHTYARHVTLFHWVTVNVAVCIRRRAPQQILC